MSIRALTIKAGEQAVLPSNIKITGVILDGATATSSCGALPDPVSRACYHLKWEFDSDDFFVSINIGGNIFLAPSFGTLDAGNANFLAQWINSTETLKDLCIANCPANAGTKAEIYVAIPETLDPPELRVTNGISTGNFDYYIKGIRDDSACPNCP